MSEKIPKRSIASAFVLILALGCIVGIGSGMYLGLIDLVRMFSVYQ